MARARYEVEIFPNKMVLVTDLFSSGSPTMSVTNDMETVMEEVFNSNTIETNYIVCKNTDLTFDIVESVKGTFKRWLRVDLDNIETAICEWEKLQCSS